MRATISSQPPLQKWMANSSVDRQKADRPEILEHSYVVHTWAEKRRRLKREKILEWMLTALANHLQSRGNVNMWWNVKVDWHHNEVRLNTEMSNGTSETKADMHKAKITPNGNISQDPLRNVGFVLKTIELEIQSLN